jgi:hypothetical protein
MSVPGKSRNRTSPVLELHMSGNGVNQASDDKLRFRASRMNLFKPAVLSPKQIERRNRIRAKGRNHYIFYTGILGWGMSVFLMTTSWELYDPVRVACSTSKRIVFSSPNRAAPVDRTGLRLGSKYVEGAF